MGKDPSEKKQPGSIGAGTTSTGVYVDAHTDFDDPPDRSAADIRREALARAAPSAKRAGRGKVSAYRRKQLRHALTAAAVVLASALFSLLAGDSLWPATEQASASPAQITATATPSISLSPAAQPTQEEARVFIPKSGSRYHLTATCSNMQDAQEVSLPEAKARGFTACKRCDPPE